LSQRRRGLLEEIKCIDASLKLVSMSLPRSTSGGCRYPAEIIRSPISKGCKPIKSEDIIDKDIFKDVKKQAKEFVSILDTIDERIKAIPFEIKHCKSKPLCEEVKKKKSINAESAIYYLSQYAHYIKLGKEPFEAMRNALMDAKGFIHD
jgi:hypothetical protein